jgi:hypothetical protein
LEYPKGSCRLKKVVKEGCQHQLAFRDFEMLDISMKCARTRCVRKKILSLVVGCNIKKGKDGRKTEVYPDPSAMGSGYSKTKPTAYRFLEVQLLDSVLGARKA